MAKQGRVPIIIEWKFKMKRYGNTDKEKPREAKGHGHPKRASKVRNKSK